LGTIAKTHEFLSKVFATFTHVANSTEKVKEKFYFPNVEKVSFGGRPEDDY
jgi:hypothetical protein